MNRLRPNPLPVVQLREALSSGLGALPDAELLDRFARYADHAAFEVLLRRHGPLVLGVCRRTLSNPADADDAFQATFLVFLRKVRQIRGGRLGPWLYGVAWRVSQKARVRAARLAAQRTEGVDMLHAADENAPIPDWLPVLDAELNALPAKYRDALVLCELQGRSRAEAARELGLREGTLSSRLARGREFLRKRLLKHGTLLPAGGLAALFGTSEVGRATVPAALLAKVSELAKGGAAAGAVPVGAARLTDEVLRSMFLSKLRIAGGAIVLLALATAGLAAGWSRESPAGDSEQVRAARGGEKNAPETRPEGQKAPGPKLVDRDALQGLWVHEKTEVGKGITEAAAGELKEIAGKMKLLVVGDVWWIVDARLRADVVPKWAALDPTKNPKWLDWSDGMVRTGKVDQRLIYELAGDTLRLCILSEGGALRAAEFVTDSDAPLIVLTFRRDKLPPPAGEQALLGSWAGAPVAVEYRGGKSQDTYTPAIEALDGFIMLAASHVRPQQNTPGWIGGTYTVDTTKNPKWIDVDLFGPMGKDDAVTKLYGCYEVRDGRLKMALGSKRATRPLEFRDVGDVLLFDLGPAKLDAPKAKPADAPMPRAKPAGAWPAEVHRLLKAGEFDAAEAFMRERLPGWSGLRKAEGHLLLGVSTLERAQKADKGEAQKLYTAAASWFRSAGAEASLLPPDDKRAAWVLAQAEVRTLQVLWAGGDTDGLLGTAGRFAEKYHKTPDGLIVLSLMYHAYRKKGDHAQAQQTRERMRERFDALKDKPGAFTAEAGEYSRAYWEQTWFSRE